MHHRSTRKFARSETSTPSTASLQLKAFRSSSKGKLAGGLSRAALCFTCYRGLLAARQTPSRSPNKLACAGETPETNAVSAALAATAARSLCQLAVQLLTDAEATRSS